MDGRVLLPPSSPSSPRNAVTPSGPAVPGELSRSSDVSAHWGSRVSEDAMVVVRSAESICSLRTVRVRSGRTEAARRRTRERSLHGWLHQTGMLVSLAVFATFGIAVASAAAPTITGYPNQINKIDLSGYTLQTTYSLGRNAGPPSFRDITRVRWMRVRWASIVGDHASPPTTLRRRSEQMVMVPGSTQSVAQSQTCSL